MNVDTVLKSKQFLSLYLFRLMSETALYYYQLLQYDIRKCKKNILKLIFSWRLYKISSNTFFRLSIFGIRSSSKTAESRKNQSKGDNCVHKLKLRLKMGI